MRRLIVFACLILTVFFVPGVFAQDDSTDLEALPPTPEAVQLEPTHVVVEASDGLDLVGDLYIVDPERPTVILLHQLYTNRTSWQPLIGLLLGANYNVLNVDQRGFGETRGSINWTQAIEDVVTWQEWLRTEGGVADAISTIGSSIGSTMAVRGCSADPACKTAIAISPGWEYYNVGLRPALEEELGERPALLIYAENDRWPALGMPRIMEFASAAIETYAYPGNAHGMDLLKTENETMVPLILDWLAKHGG
ncbi:MAG: hypothetical protein CL607_27025 [Anaerolineaceae bacterium]|nr:hypothetical protein [Anaerolineaceae bacterium]